MSISTITHPAQYSIPAPPPEAVPSTLQQKPGEASNKPAVQETNDIVHLSQVAQIQSMSQHGESPTMIASETGLLLTQVDSDLGLSTTASSATSTETDSSTASHTAADAHSTATQASPQASVSADVSTGAAGRSNTQSETQSEHTLSTEA